MMQIKDHRICVSTVSDGLDNLMGGLESDISYTDPPWGPGLESYFYNLIKEPTYPKPTALLSDLMQALKTHTRAGHPIFVEYGQKWRGQVLGIAKESGLDHTVTLQAIYSGGQHDLHLFNSEPKFDPGAIPQTIKGKALARLAIKAHARPNGVLLDPCCGLGYFARIAIENQMRFFGNEPNPERLAVTEKYLRAHT